MSVKTAKRQSVDLASVGDCDIETIELNRTKKTHRLANRLLSCMFFFLACDTHPSIKRNHLDQTSQQLADLGSKSARETKLREQIIDLGEGEEAGTAIASESRHRRLFERWTLIYIIVCTYFALKPLTIFCLRFYLNWQTLVLDGRSSTSTESELRLEWLLDFLGDPYCSLPQLTPLVYLGIPVGALLFNCFITISYRKIIPFDSSLVRFLLTPRQELREVDAQTLEMVNRAFDGVECRRKELSSMLEKRWILRTLNRRQTDEHLEEDRRSRIYLRRLMNQSTMLRYLKQRLGAIRPKAFGWEWYRYCSYGLVMTSGFVVVSNMFIFTLSVLAIAYFTWRRRCDRMLENQGGDFHQTAIANCSISELFTVAEIQSLAEEGFSIVFFTNTPVSFFFIVAIWQIQHQHQLTKNTMEKLSMLLSELCSFSSRVEQTNKDRADGGGSTELDRSRLDRLMFENIIGIWNYEVDAKRSSAMVTHMAQLYLALIFTAGLSAFGMYNPLVTARSVPCRAHPLILHPTAAEELNDTQVKEIPIIILVMVWTYGNVGWLACASVPSGVIPLKRLVISIFAQIVQLDELQSSEQKQARRKRRWRQPLDGLRLRHSRTQSTATKMTDRMEQSPDPLLSFWRKTVLARDFATEHYPVHLYGVELTHERILELNFGMVSFGSWLTAKYYQATNSGEETSLLAMHEHYVLT